jgi:hypothetical protein
MIELLTELIGYCLKFLRAELPDCECILNEIRSGRRTLATTARPYVWLCHLYAVGILLRVVAVTWLLIAVGDLALHSTVHWPPWTFDEGNRHLIFMDVALGTSPPLPTAVHVCEGLAIMSATAFIGFALFYDGIARLSRLIVRECCPLIEATKKVSRRAA